MRFREFYEAAVEMADPTDTICVEVSAWRDVYPHSGQMPGDGKPRIIYNLWSSKLGTHFAGNSTKDALAKFAEGMKKISGLDPIGEVDHDSTADPQPAETTPVAGSSDGVAPNISSPSEVF